MHHTVNYWTTLTTKTEIPFLEEADRSKKGVKFLVIVKDNIQTNYSDDIHTDNNIN